MTQQGWNCWGDIYPIGAEVFVSLENGKVYLGVITSHIKQYNQTKGIVVINSGNGYSMHIPLLEIFTGKTRIEVINANKDV